MWGVERFRCWWRALGVGEAPNVNLVLARKACVYSTRGIENLHKKQVEPSLVYVEDGLPLLIFLLQQRRHLTAPYTSGSSSPCQTKLHLLKFSQICQKYMIPTINKHLTPLFHPFLQLIRITSCPTFQTMHLRDNVALFPPLPSLFFCTLLECKVQCIYFI